MVTQDTPRREGPSVSLSHRRVDAVAGGLVADMLHGGWGRPTAPVARAASGGHERPEDILLSI